MPVSTTPLYFYYSFRLSQLSGLLVSFYSTVVPASGSEFKMAYIQKEQKIAAAMRRRLEMAVNVVKWFR